MPEPLASKSASPRPPSASKGEKSCPSDRLPPEDYVAQDEIMKVLSPHVSVLLSKQMRGQSY